MNTKLANLIVVFAGVFFALGFVISHAKTEALSSGVGCWTRNKSMYSMSWHCDGSASARNRPYDIWVWHCNQANLSWCDANNGGTLVSLQNRGGPVPVEFTSTAGGYPNCGSVQMDIGLPGASDHGVAGGAIYSNGRSCSGGGGNPPGPTTPPSSCGNHNDTQFWTGCYGEPYGGCGGLSGWISGNDVTRRNPNRPFPLDINCFTNLGSAWTSANIRLKHNGSTIYSTGNWAARNITISQPGTYEALCRQNNNSNCYDIDRFTVQCNNTCGGTRRPNAPSLRNPGNGVTLTNRTVTLRWSHSGFGRCGGNNCTGSCNSVNPRNIIVTLNGPGGGTRVLASNATSTTFSNLTGKNYSWFVTARNGCNLSRQSATRTFIINSPPTTSGNVSSNQVCTPSGTSTSGAAEWSGIHPNATTGDGTAGINNPVTVRARYDDPDGRSDLDRLEIWLADNSSGAPASNRVGTSASGSLQYNATGNHTLIAAGGSNATINDANTQHFGVVTGGSTQQVRQITGSTTGTAYAEPVIVSEDSTGVTVDWQLGLLNSSAFDGDVRIYSRVVDKSGVAAGWVQIDTWKVDLKYPNTVANVTLRNQTSFDVRYTASDTTSSVISTAKSCESVGFDLTESITLTQVSPGVSGTNARTFTGNATQSVCFDNLAGTTYYTVSNTPRDGILRFNWTARDQACNGSPTESGDLTLLPPWLMTVDGDTFSSESIDQTSIIDIDRIVNPNLQNDPGLTDLHNTVPYLSDYNYMEDLANQALPAKDTENDFAIQDYDDLNGKPREETGFPDWYSFVDNQLRRNLDASQIATISGDKVYTNVTTQQIAQAEGMAGVQVNGFAGTDEDKINVMYFQGNLQMNRVTCNTKTIFMVEGDLSLNPEMRIQDTPTNDIINGCMYVVGGKTSVLPGGNADILGASTEKGESLSASVNQAVVDLAAIMRFQSEAPAEVTPNPEPEVQGEVLAARTDGVCRVGLYAAHDEIQANFNSTRSFVTLSELQQHFNYVTSGLPANQKELRTITSNSTLASLDNLDLIIITDGNNGQANANPTKNFGNHLNIWARMESNWLNNGTNVLITGDHSRFREFAGGNMIGDHAAGTAGPAATDITNGAIRYYYDETLASSGQPKTDYDNWRHHRNAAGEYFLGWSPRQNFTLNSNQAPAFYNGATINLHDTTPGSLVVNTGLGARCIYNATLYGGDGGSGDVVAPGYPYPASAGCIVAYIPQNSYGAYGAPNNGWLIVDGNTGHPSTSRLTPIIDSLADCKLASATPSPTPTPTNPPANPGGPPVLNSINATCTASRDYQINANWSGGGTGNFYLDIDTTNPFSGTWHNYLNGNSRNLNRVDGEFVQYNSSNNSYDRNNRLALTPGRTYYAKVYDTQRGENSNVRSFTVSACPTPSPTPTPTPPAADTDLSYDRVDGFILTNSFESPFDNQYDGLKVVGSIITNENNDFRRDNGVVMNPLTPAEIIYYDGGRYMYLFGKVLSTPSSFTIVEKPFIESF